MTTFIRIATLLTVLSMLAFAQQREIARITFDGATVMGADKLRGVIQSQETPMTVWKWLYSVSENVGSPPQYFDPLILDSDVWSLRRFYEDQGFISASVDTVVQMTEDRVFITFRIVEGPRAMIDSVIVKGVDHLPAGVREEMMDQPLIAPGQPFVMSRVEAEFRRLVGIFSNTGYINASTKARQAVARTDALHYSVIFDFDPGQRHQFGEIDVVRDTASVELVDRDVVVRQLDFRNGDIYSEQKKSDSERLLARLGIFDAVRIENAVPKITSDLVQVPVRVLVRTRSFQELTPEVGFNDENNAFNALVGLGYSHRNFFGGARNFNIGLRYSLQSILSARLNKIFSKSGLQDSALVSKIELTAQITQPYFFSNKVSLTGSLSGILDKQKDYYIPVVRSKVGVIAQTATYTRLFVDWNLEWIDPRSVTTQQDTAILDYRQQFNSILTMTIQRDLRNDLFTPTSGSLQSLTLEESGLLPHAFGGVFGSRLPYSQYLKVVGLAQYYWDPGKPRGAVWAAKLRVGLADLYGKNTVDIPLTRKFFGGGSSSVRGWKARELGAMEIPSNGGRNLLEGSLETRLNAFEEGGEFLFMDLNRISFVLFSDIGNVWEASRDIRLSEVAIAAGFGFRYMTVAGPIRIDFGMKMYDPQSTPGQRWVTEHKFFKETFTGGVIHLGILHAF